MPPTVHAVATRKAVRDGYIAQLRARSDALAVRAELLEALAIIASRHAGEATDRLRRLREPRSRAVLAVGDPPWAHRRVPDRSPGPDDA
jgi:hypothetical protein